MVPVQGSSGSTASTQFLFAKAKAKAKAASTRENTVRYGQKTNVVKNQERLLKS